MFKEAFNRLPLTISTVGVSKSLLTPTGVSALPERRAVYQSLATTEARLPIETDDTILPEFSETISNRNIVINHSELTHPYWDKKLTYNPWHVFSGSIQFFDDHRETLPHSVLPPEKDVAKYMQSVLNSHGPLRLSEQFNVLLDIADNNIVGAANVGFIGSRIGARFADSRAYPGIYFGEEEARLWNQRVTQIEVFGENIKYDASGDTYYFWTHMFAAMSFASINTPESKLLSGSFRHGTNVMRAARNMAGVPITTPHREASMLGRNIGLALIST